jgi:magnesium-transporting ATPase (P-type)
MFKRTALGLAIAIIGLGILFMLLDILDIAEGYRLHWSIAWLNTIFIGTVAILIACFSARNYLVNGPLETLSLGCAACSFGSGILLYGWLDTGLNPRIIAYDSGFLFASIVIITGAVLKMVGRTFTESTPRHRLRALLIVYSGIIAIIGTVTWLASQEYIIYVDTTLWDINVRNIVRGIAAILYTAPAVIYIMIYLSKSRSDTYYLYFLGLILLACGIIFVSLGPLESRIAWLGRVSQYTGCVYLLVSALRAVMRRETAEHT